MVYKFLGFWGGTASGWLLRLRGYADFADLADLSLAREMERAGA